ncbi:MAG: di-heme oxidoredictase family protein [Gemmatimonadaceae bacterium]
MFQPIGIRRARAVALMAAVAAVAAVAAAVGCGQLLTEAPAEGDLFDAAIAGLTPGELAAFNRGDAEFGRRFAPAEGLGPIFNNVSCISCHSGDGRGRLENALQRIGAPDDDFLRGVGGHQIQDRAIAGAESERVPAGAAVSVRLPPPVFGVGLIEAIPEHAILSREDPQDLDGDGISGRANLVLASQYVPHSEPGSGTAYRVGRFGRKAQVSNLVEQVVEAYHQDMGVTSTFQPIENRNPLGSPAADASDRVADPEIPSSTVFAVVNYIRMLAPPHAGPETVRRTEGRTLFGTLRCARCHTPQMLTGPSVIAALSNRPVELYSDLLLHDMGDALADNRPDGAASGREWRTTPLWGLRLMRQFLNGDAFLMHDGRARTVEEAILLHGGEAKASRDAFAALAGDKKAALLDFVESR